MDCTELSFPSYDEFSHWKSAEEESTSSNFVMHGGSVVKETVKHTYFYCNRSGVSRKGRKLGARTSKMQETSKIGATCVAHMKLEQNIVSGSCKVHYNSTHCGHKKELAHIRLTDSSRVKIASQLQAGVSINNILDSIRDVSLKQGIKREHLIVKQDIRNIERVLNLSNIQKHANDQTSVAIWVQEALTQPYNPVLVFKPQGRKDSVVGLTDDLEEKNFILAIQTEFQRDAMKLFAGNGRVVCVDATHGTNVYDFFLITVMVLDDYGEGVPVAWCISDREDTSLLSQFFKHLHERVGDIGLDYFMSDDAEQYHTAWCGVFGPVKKKLLCIWHVDRAWKKAIHAHVLGDEQKAEVYHMLRVLLNETSITDFQVLLSQAMSYFEEKHPRFYEYMKTTYATRSDQWATCHRINASIGTNMAIEAFHRVLKIEYLQHKQNRRLDHLLHVLFRINRDLVFNFLRKEEIGKRSHRLCEIQKRHISAVTINKKGIDIQSNDCDSWKVQSESTPDLWYIVEKIASTCNLSCKLRCNKCNICTHMFSCNCMDAVMHFTICKHIHLVCMHCQVSCNSNVELPSIDSTAVDDSQPVTVATCITSAGPGSSVPSSLGTLSKESLLKKHDKVRDMIVRSSGQNLLELNSHLSSMMALLQTQVDVLAQPLPVRKRPAPNANHVTQDKFYSTKKRRTEVTKAIKKPSSEEQTTIKSHLSQVDITVCSICFNSDDDHRQESDVQWIECVKCSTWVHQSCAKRTFLSSSIDLESFECFRCITSSN